MATASSTLLPLLVKVKGSLAVRLVAGAALWAVALLVAGAFVLTTQYRQSVHRVSDEQQNAVIESLAAFAEMTKEGKLYLTRQPGDSQFERTFSGKYWQISVVDDKAVSVGARSESLFDAELKLPDTQIAKIKKNMGQNVELSLVGPAGEPLRALARAIRLPDQASILLLIAAVDRRPVDREISRFRTLVAWILGVFATGLVIAVVLQVRVGMAPIYKMGDSIAQIRKGQSERISGEYPAELAPLAEQLNNLLQHNKEIVERARTHVGNLAHALKTPISVLLNETSARKTDVDTLVQRQASIMAKQVDHHLRRASAAARAQAIGARASVNGTLEDLTRTLRRLFPDQKITISYVTPETLTFRGERQDLDELLGNLLENACKWAKSEIRVKADAVSATLLQVIVEDDGPGLPPEKRKAVMQRGERLDETAPGSGLGLSIVKDLVGAYQGKLFLEDSSLGGLSVRIQLPSITLDDGGK